jgi:hypothetical protein
MRTTDEWYKESQRWEFVIYDSAEGVLEFTAT